MKNVTDLRNELEDVFSSLKRGQIESTVAQNLVATANAMMKTAKLQLEEKKNYRK